MDINPTKEALMADPKKPADANRDPISGAPGAHPVGVGAGAAGGGATGAAVGGAVGGPVGAVVGGRWAPWPAAWPARARRKP